MKKRQKEIASKWGKIRLTNAFAEIIIKEKRIL